MLRGVVNSYYQKQMAQEAIRRVEGVQSIENHLEVDWSLRGAHPAARHADTQCAHCCVCRHCHRRLRLGHLPSVASPQSLGSAGLPGGSAHDRGFRDCNSGQFTLRGRTSAAALRSSADSPQSRIMPSDACTRLCSHSNWLISLAVNCSTSASSNTSR